MEQRSNPAPKLSDVFRAQVGLLMEKPWGKSSFFYGIILLQGVLSASAGVFIGFSIEFEAGEDAIYSMPQVTDLGLEPGPAAIFVTFLLMVVWATAWPGRVWRGGTAGSTDYFESLPVSWSAHQLVRLSAGGLVLSALCLLLLTVTTVTAALFGHGAPLAEFPLSAWLCYLTGPLLTYLFLSAFPMRGRRVWSYLGIAIGLSILSWSLLNFAGVGDPVNRIARQLLVGEVGFITALADPILRTNLAFSWPARPWMPALLLWSALAAATVAWTSTRGRRQT
ncbi:MAG: hypothetical protein K0U98_23965 [Deltaproteobacteria bacterium]|nr:hypothetical protein [Deltaproteobacteria bacterium]